VRCAVRLGLVAAALAAGVVAASRFTGAGTTGASGETAAHPSAPEPFEGPRASPSRASPSRAPTGAAPPARPSAGRAPGREPAPSPALADDEAISPETRALIDGNVEVASRALEVQVLRARAGAARETVEREYEAARAAQRARLEAAGVLDPRSP
jgi:hypothetical protein